MFSGDTNDVGISGNVDVFISLDDWLILMLLISVDIGEFALCSKKDIFEICSDCKLLFMFGGDIFEVFSDCKMLFMFEFEVLCSTDCKLLFVFNVDMLDVETCCCSVIDALVSFWICKLFWHKNINQKNIIL